MTDLVEEVARDICLAAGQNPDAKQRLGRHEPMEFVLTWTLFIVQAKAAIAIVLREAADVAEHNGDYHTAIAILALAETGAE